MRFRALCLSGMALILPALVLSSAAQENAQAEEIFANPESLVRGLYAAVTFGPGSTPNWDYVRKFFIPEAVFGVRMTPASMAVLSIQGFVEWFVSDIQKYKMDERGFEESIEKIKMTVFADIAQCFVVYKARFKTPPELAGQLGLDSFSLMKKDGRWWIISIANDIITAQNSLPEELR